MSPDDRQSEDRARLVLPQLRLDDLLTELQGRLSAVLTTRDRVHGLLEAIVSIGSDLDLETVLRSIVEAAVTLVDARYGALGVIGEHDRLSQFITAGITQEQVDALEHWPHGLGILGLLIKNPQPIRLPDLSAHPESYGFPANHPPMHRFLGVPIRVRDEVFGNLYLTEKAGGEEFDEEDESVVSALATAAGVAIENARLYQDARRRERWLRASAEISTALLSGTDPDEALDLIVHRARDICDADLATVALLDPASDELVVWAADGRDAEAFDGMRLSLNDVAGQVFHSGTSVALHDVTRTTGDFGPHVPRGPALLVPLGAEDAIRGVLLVANSPGNPAFGQAAHQLLETFAAQAAIALELAERRRDAERVVLLEDRDRIAKDLHDTVIQRLFATAMTLMSAIKITQKRDVAVRVQRAVDDLDDTIRQIRSTIFALQISPDDEQTLRSRLHNVIDGATASLRFAPTVRFDGLLDIVVDDTTAENLLAVLREALSNVARHARATKADIIVTAGSDLLLCVTDNGVGITDSGRRSGLANMEARAKELGGAFDVRPAGENGTRLEWRVPLTS